MKLPKRVTCKSCGHRKKIRWEIMAGDLAAGYSNCSNCGVSQMHFLGKELTISKLAEVAKQEVDLFEPGVDIQRIR